jgi:hypothetical protein
MLLDIFADDGLLLGSDDDVLRKRNSRACDNELAVSWAFMAIF